MTESARTDIGAQEAKLGTRIRITHIGSPYEQEYVGQTGVVLNVFWPGPHYKIGVGLDSGQYISLCEGDRVEALPDYRDLLKRYMRIIRFSEGGDHIPVEPNAYEDLGPSVLFSEADIAELEAIADENLREINASKEGLK